MINFLKDIWMMPSDWYYWHVRQPKLRERMRREGNDNPQDGIGDDIGWALAERLNNTAIGLGRGRGDYSDKQSWLRKVINKWMKI